MDVLLNAFAPIATYVAETAAENAGTLVAIWLLLTLVGRLAPELKAHHWYARIEPALPFALGVAAVFIPGWIDDPELVGVGAKIKHGITLGGLAMGLHKLWRQ